MNLSFLICEMGLQFLHRFIERIQCHSMGKTWGQGLTLRNVSLLPPDFLLPTPVLSYVEIQILVSFLSSPKCVFFYNFPTVFFQSLSFLWEGP